MWFNSSAELQDLEETGVLVKGVPKLEGEYILQRERSHGRPTYKYTGSSKRFPNKAHNLVLWSKGSSWLISRAEHVGDSAYAFVMDSSKSPLQIQGVWKLYDMQSKTWEKVINLRIERKPRSLPFAKKHTLPGQVRKTSSRSGPIPTMPRADARSPLPVSRPRDIRPHSSPLKEENSLDNLLSRLYTANPEPTKSRSERPPPAPNLPTFTERKSAGTAEDIFKDLTEPFYERTSPTRKNRSSRDTLDNMLADLNHDFETMAPPSEIPDVDITVPSDLGSQVPSVDLGRERFRVHPPKSEVSEVSAATSVDTETSFAFYQRNLQELCTKLQEVPNQIDAQGADIDELCDSFELDREKLQDLEDRLRPEVERLEALSLSHKASLEEKKASLAKAKQNATELDVRIESASQRVSSLEEEVKKIDEEIFALEQRKTGVLEEITKQKEEMTNIQEERRECDRNLKRCATHNSELESHVSTLKVLTTNIDLAKRSLDSIQNLLAERQSLHELNWREWDSYNVVSWICRMNNSQFAKYKAFWREAFDAQKITGKMLPKLDMSTLNDLGVTVLEDRCEIHKNIQALIGEENRRNSIVLAPGPIHLDSPEKLDATREEVTSVSVSIDSTTSAGWKQLLENWNLEQFIESFAKNGYDDATDWGELSDEELKELGMKTGHLARFRRRFKSFSSK